MTETSEGQIKLITRGHPVENTMKAKLFELLYQGNVTASDYIFFLQFNYATS